MHPWIQSRILRHGLGGLALLAVAGCEASWQLHGRVVTGAGVPLPLPAAQVELLCPAAVAGSHAQLSALDGTFALSGTGLLPMECAIAVGKRGYAPRRLNVGVACTQPVGASGCRSAEVSAALELDPAPAATTAARD